MLPNQNLFLPFKYPSQGICYNCNVVVRDEFIKKIRKYSRTKIVKRRLPLTFISPWSYKN